MCSNKQIRWLFVLIALLSLQCAAHASIMLSGTRVILREQAREASLPMKNYGTAPYVVQAWIDAGEGKNKTPLLVSPPLSRLDPGKENILRIMRAGGELPSDRESVFWINVKEIPQKSQEENVLQIALQNRLKVFYRPAGLEGSSAESRSKLKWAVSADAQGQGAILRVANPTPYHITLVTLNINNGQQIIDPGMLPPFGELSYPLSAIKTPQAVQVNFVTINDYGAGTPEEFVKVPAAPEPVAVQAEPVPKKPEASATDTSQR
ncbi:fimbrial chaperone protein [Variovorax sp. PDC80]|nr:fimbrial chaperone protein [Variovorax sp. PDC80]